METFQTLTCYLPIIKTDSFGKWICGKSSNSNLIQMPFVSYSDMVRHFIHDVYGFVDLHPDYGLDNYSAILESNNIKWEKHSLESADVTKLDEKCVMALLVGAVRAERFCDGVLLALFENGTIRKWLLRLKELN